MTNVIIADALYAIGKKLEEISNTLAVSGDLQLPDELAAPQVTPIDPAQDPAKAPMPATVRAPVEASRHGKPGIRLDDNLEPPATVPAKPAADEVKALMVRLCKRGLSSEVKAIIGHYGATSLGGVDPRHYGDLFAEAMALEANSTNDNDSNTEVHND